MAKKLTPSERIYQACRATRDSDGEAWIQSKDVATLIRARLRATFPGVKFSVTCSRGDAVNIRWTNGPRGSTVDDVVQPYRFGGFDGMIDMAYDSANWLHPDGSMTHAATSGTEGSRGTVPASATDCPAPGAVLVRGGPKYVFTQQDITPDVWEAAGRAVLAKFGGEWAEGRSIHEQQLPHGEYVTHYLHRSGDLDEALEAMAAV